MDRGAPVAGGPPTFGQKLRSLREAAGLSQEELAERARVSADAVSSLERGARTHPYPATVRALADALSLPPSEQAALVAAVARRVRPRAPMAGSAPPPRLPVPLTPLIGRDADTTALTTLLQTSRLVTLVGPGGAGKTTLALAAARTLQHGFDDGARVVRLAPVTESAQVDQAVADALAVGVEGVTPGVRPRQRVVDYLALRRLLLVIDNCEHVVDAAAALAEGILAECPGVSVLVTSREALVLPGEIRFPVPPLAVPPPHTPPAEVMKFAAAQLLVQRGRAVRPDLVLDDASLAAVAQVCQQLDGMPLALELAAARLRALSPGELAGRLADRFGLLTTGSRTAEARQRTLRATIDWSYDLLDEADRTAFRRLAVMQGGWTLEAAEHVLDADNARGRGVLDQLTRLIDRSLVESDLGLPTRFRMLETLRQYAAERLASSGEASDAASRHAAYFGDLADRAEAGLRGHDQRAWLQRMRAEQPNLRTALAWLSADPGRVDGALHLAGALGWFWHLGRHVEGREILDRVIRLPGGSALPRARALQAVSLVERPRACLVHPSPRCAETAQESLRLFEAGGHTHQAAFSRVLLAVEGVSSTHSAESEQLLAAAEAQFAAEKDDWGHAVAEFVRMETAIKSGRDGDAIRHGHSGAEVFRALDDPWGLSAVQYHLGWGLRQFGRHAEAVPVLQEAVDVALSAELHNTAQWAAAEQGIALLDLGDAKGAAFRFDRIEAAAVDSGDGVGAVLAAYGRGLLARSDTDPQQARDQFTAALAGFERLSTPVYVGLAHAGVAWSYEHDDLVTARRHYERALSLARTVAEPALSAAALEGLARVAVSCAEPDHGRRLLAEAETVRARTKRPPTPVEVRELTDLTARLANVYA